REYIGHGCRAVDLLCPSRVETSGPVVQQRRIGGPQRCRDSGIALVTGRSDRVETLALALQPATREIEVTALELGVEQRHQAAAFDALGGRIGERCRSTRIVDPRADAFDEVV